MDLDSDDEVETNTRATKGKGKKPSSRKKNKTAKEEEEHMEDTEPEPAGGMKRKTDVEVPTQEEPALKKRRLMEETNHNDVDTIGEDKIISFLIQGKRVSTFQSTLTKVPKTKLHETFKGDPTLPTNQDGCYILDRPRKAFTGILNFLRSGKFYVPKQPEQKAEFEAEIEYWGLTEHYNKDGGGWALFEGTTLLDKTQQKQLNDWFGKTDKRWKLLYKASRDGFEATEFHKRCDKKGSTMTVLSANGYLFGGYTPLSWESRGGYAWDESSWIYSLTNPTNEPTKLVNIVSKGKEQKYSIHDQPDQGPTFGGGHDIAVFNAANASSQNYANVGYNYQLPGKAYGTEESKNFMVGTYNFSVSEIEVFGFADNFTPTPASITNSSNSSSSSAMILDK